MCVSDHGRYRSQAGQASQTQLTQQRSCCPAPDEQASPVQRQGPSASLHQCPQTGTVAPSLRGLRLPAAALGGALMLLLLRLWAQSLPRSGPGTVQVILWAQALNLQTVRGCLGMIACQCKPSRSSWQRECMRLAELVRQLWRHQGQHVSLPPSALGACCLSQSACTHCLLMPSAVLPKSAHTCPAPSTEHS